MKSSSICWWYKINWQAWLLLFLASIFRLIEWVGYSTSFPYLSAINVTACGKNLSWQRKNVPSSEIYQVSFRKKFENLKLTWYEINVLTLLKCITISELSENHDVCQYFGLPGEYLLSHALVIMISFWCLSYVQCNWSFLMHCISRCRRKVWLVHM